MIPMHIMWKGPHQAKKRKKEIFISGEGEEKRSGLMEEVSFV